MVCVCVCACVYVCVCVRVHVRVCVWIERGVQRGRSMQENNLASC